MVEEFIYRAAMEKQTQKTDLWTQEWGEKGDLYGESSMETYITMCKIESQQEFAVSQETQTGLCINLEGWEGEGDMYTYG